MLQAIDDLSSLGADHESEVNTVSMQSVEMPQAEQQERMSQAGDIDDDDVAADRKLYFEANQLIVDGFKCPDEFIQILTPMEFEELVGLFVAFDANKSGSIDKHEAKKILHHLGIYIQGHFSL